MLKLDTHQHYWRYRSADFPWISDAMPTLQCDRLPADVSSAMQSAAVHGVVAVQARCHVVETDFLLALAAQRASIVGVVGWTDCMSADAPQRIASWREHVAFKGLRHILQDEHDVSAWVNAKPVSVTVSALQQHRLVYDVLVFDRQLPQVLEFCRRHDKHWLVLDHVGKPALATTPDAAVPSTQWRQHIKELAAMPHMMCKLSGLVTETAWSQQPRLAACDRDNILRCFDVALDAFGAERLMYGSDWPVCTLAAPYDTVHGLAQDWAMTRLSAHEQENFWARNAVRCYDLNVTHLMP